MKKLLKRRSDETDQSDETTKTVDRKTVIADRLKSKQVTTTDNPLLSSVPLHMQQNMQFINDRNAKAKAFVSASDSESTVTDLEHSEYVNRLMQFGRGR